MSDYSAEQFEAIKRVVERVSANWDGSPESKVETELTDGFAEADVTVAPEDVQKLTDAIHDKRGDVDPQEVLS